MADAVTTQTLGDDGTYVCMRFTNISDGTGESAVTKVTAANLVNSSATSRYCVEAIAWNCVGMGFNLLWKATGNVVFFTTGKTSNAGFTDFINGNAGKIGTGGAKIGILNNAGTGVTGDILLTTAGHAAGTTYDLTLWLRKTVA